MSLRASAPQLRAKSRLRRLRYARGLRAVWRGNLPDFRTFSFQNLYILFLLGDCHTTYADLLRDDIYILGLLTV